MEVWKDIDGYEGLYQVSNLGRVRSLDRYDLYKRFHRGVVLIPKQERPDRYLTVSLWKNGKHSLRYVHRLVASEFIENNNNLPEVNHIDENKTNNTVSNLEWCDRAYNANYGKLKNHFKGVKNPSAKLCESDVRQIRKLIELGLTDTEIADRFEVTTSNINYIRRGKTWGWVV